MRLRDASQGWIPCNNKNTVDNGRVRRGIIRWIALRCFYTLMIDSDREDAPENNRKDEGFQTDSWRNNGRHGLVAEPSDLWNGAKP